MNRIEGGGRGGSLHAMINLPVAPDRLAVRLVGYGSRRPGYVDNLVLGREDVNAVSVYGGRLAVRYRPSDRTNLTVSALVQDQVVGDSNAFDGTVGDYVSTYAAQLPFPNRFSLINAVLQQDFGFARMVASSSWYDWTATKYIDTTHAALVARANGTYCARYVGISGVCNSEQLGRYRDYVTSILPVVGHQPMTVCGPMHSMTVCGESF